MKPAFRADLGATNYSAGGGEDKVLMGLTFHLGMLKYSEWEVVELGLGMSPTPGCV